ncbi:MAG: L,D-transpeptidase catalytic domain [Verrucomicrobiaceae bacterium]|nr:L,D-transpeptidase catalytic domain [Verrucomicrobiaceae bacterium]
MIYLAVIAEDDEFVDGLLLSGFSPNDPTPDGDTALCAAVRSGRNNTVRSLLAHGARVDMPGGEGQLPVALAALRRHYDILEALLNAGADVNTQFASPMDEGLLKTVNVDDLRHHLQSDRGVTLLMACAARGDVESAVVLLKHAADTEVNTRRFNRYALDFAAEQQYLFLMRVLLGRSADSEPDLLVTVDLGRQRAWIKKAGKIIDSTSISSGRDGFDTPSGRYVVTDKHREWTSTLYKASMPWFMRLNCSSIGLHAGYVTGHPASHGCIRLPPEKAREWFKLVGVGDEVQIVE